VALHSSSPVMTDLGRLKTKAESAFSRTQKMGTERKVMLLRPETVKKEFNSATLVYYQLA